VRPLIIPKNRGPEAFESVFRFLSGLSPDKPWQITVKPFRRLRSESQNKYLWGAVYPTILQDGGEALAGWTKDDLHEFFLGEHFGWETIEGFGRRRMKPLRRSKALNTTEFMDFVDFIQRKAAEMGIYIADPNE
jgi:hypothetical protein